MLLLAWLCCIPECCWIWLGCSVRLCGICWIAVRLAFHVVRVVSFWGATRCPMPAGSFSFGGSAPIPSPVWLQLFLGLLLVGSYFHTDQYSAKDCRGAHLHVSKALHRSELYHQCSARQGPATVAFPGSDLGLWARWHCQAAWLSSPCVVTWQELVHSLALPAIV